LPRKGSGISARVICRGLEKIEQLRDLALTWHFIGRLQANKTRVIAETFDWVTEWTG